MRDYRHMNYKFEEKKELKKFLNNFIRLIKKQDSECKFLWFDKKFEPIELVEFTTEYCFMFLCTNKEVIWESVYNYILRAKDDEEFSKWYTNKYKGDNLKSNHLILFFLELTLPYIEYNEWRKIEIEQMHFLLKQRMVSSDLLKIDGYKGELHTLLENNFIIQEDDCKHLVQRIDEGIFFSFI